jgi:hypothetical protein
MAKLVAAGVTLRDQLNDRFPKRDKRSDGWIGDYAHSTRASLHNPDKDGRPRSSVTNCSHTCGPDSITTASFTLSMTAAWPRVRSRIAQDDRKRSGCGDRTRR